MSLLKWLAKKWFFYQGIRFYESKGLPSNAESIRTQFSGETRAHDAVGISFEFYREVFRDKVYRRGRFIEKDHHVFIIKASFGGKLDEKFLKLNDSKLLCRSSIFPVVSDEIIAEILQSLYIAYLRETTSRHHSEIV